MTFVVGRAPHRSSPRRRGPRKAASAAMPLWMPAFAGTIGESTDASPRGQKKRANLSPPSKPPLHTAPSLLTRGRAHEASSVRSRLKGDRHGKHPMSIGAAPADLRFAAQIAGRPSRIARGQYDPLPVVVGRKAGGRASNSQEGEVLQETGSCPSRSPAGV